MSVNDPNSHRTLTFEGVGSEWENAEITNLKRFDEETGELLERDEWEYESEESDEIEGGCEYEFLQIFLTNNDTGERVCLNETKTFEELGIKVIGLDDCLKEMDKEDEKVREYVDDSKLNDDDYRLLVTENFKGIWKQMDFYEGEEFDVELITIYVNREVGENLCRFEYDGDELDGHNLSGSGVTEEILPY